MPIKFEFTGDASDLSRALKDVVGGMNDVKTKTDAASFSLKEMIKQSAAFAGVGLGAAGLKEFAASMVSVRREIQGFETSFNVLLGSKEKATAMFGELKEFAVTTPLMLKDFAGGAQTMLGFNIAAEKVVPTLKAIGDISMGDSQRFNSLTLAFSQMSATGKLMGQDLLQMINAGFNPLMEISRKTGKSISELKDEMSAGTISAEMVADAFKSATSEGGQFFGMLEQQGKGISGQMNTLQGAIDDMLNTLGQKSEGFIIGSIQDLTSLVQNYEKVGKVLVSIVATYGAYKASLMTLNALQNLEVAGAMASASAQGVHAVALGAATKAAKLLNTTLLANPYVACATLLMGFVGAVWASESAMTADERAASQYNKRIKERNSLVEEAKKSTAEWIGVLEDENQADIKKQDALNNLKRAYPELFGQYDIESLKLEDIIEKKREIARLDNIKAAAQNKKTLDDIDAEIARYQKLAKVQNGGLSASETQKLQDLRDQRKLAQEDYGKDIANSFTSVLKNVDEKEIDKYIAVLTNKIKGRANEEKIEMKLPVDVEGTLSENAIFNVSDIRNLIDIAKTRKNAKNTEQEEKQNKSFWEGKKKEAESRLAALTDIQAKGKEGAAIKKEIDEYERRIEAFSTSKKGDATKQAEEDAKRLREITNNQQIEEARQARDTELNTQQARIDAMKEGTEKVLAQIDIDYSREKEAIKREEEDLKIAREQAAKELWEAQNADIVRKNPDAWVKSGQQKQWLDNYQQSQQEREYFAAKNQAADLKLEQQVKAETEAAQNTLRDYLATFGNYQEQRQAITEKYEKQIEQAQANGLDRMVQLLKEQLSQEVAVIDEKFGQAKQGIESIFDDLDRASRDSISKAVTAYQQLLDAMADGTLSTHELEGLQNIGFSYTFLTQVKNGGESVTNLRDALKQLQQKSLDSSTAIEKLGQAFKDAFDGSKSPEQRMEALFGAIGQVQQAVGMVTNTVADMADAFGNAGLASVMDDINQVMDTTMSMAQQGGAIAGPWGAAAGAAMGLVSSITQVFSRRHDDRLQKQIEQLDRSLTRLDRSFSELEDQVNKSFGEYKSSAYQQQINNLNQQNALIRQQIALEERKKKTDKDAIESYREQLYQNTRRINELRESAKDAIFGSDLQSAISSFADAYADAWSSNLNRTRTAKEQVREMMQQMVTESIKAAVDASGAMERIRAKMADYYRDGVLSEAEQAALYSEAEKIQQELDARFSWADDLFDKDKDFTNTTSGGFKAMSQESADELNGRFAAMQIGQEMLISQSIQLVNGQDNTNSILSDLLTAAAIRNGFMSDIIERMDRMHAATIQRIEAIQFNTSKL